MEWLAAANHFDFRDGSGVLVSGEGVRVAWNRVYRESFLLSFRI